LTDGVIVVRPWNRSDADWVFDACQDPGIQRWTRVSVPYTEGDAESFVTTLADTNWKDERGAHFGVVDATTGQGLGSVGLHDLDIVSGVGEAGYRTAPGA
jgi:RimJ/RimL family protein N-acetyltransferase